MLHASREILLFTARYESYSLAYARDFLRSEREGRNPGRTWAHGTARGRHFVKRQSEFSLGGARIPKRCAAREAKGGLPEMGRIRHSAPNRRQSN